MAARKLIHRFIGAGVRNRVAMFLSFAAKKPSVVQSFTLSSNCLLGIWALFLQMGVEESQFANQIGILFPLLLQFTMQALFIVKGAWISASLFFLLNLYWFRTFKWEEYDEERRDHLNHCH